MLQHLSEFFKHIMCVLVEYYGSISNWLFSQVGLKYNESVVIRMTGCPNGCARPYMAELGFVGDGPNSYQVVWMLSLFLFFIFSFPEIRIFALELF